MKLSTNGLNLIKKFEGCRLTAYKPVSSERYYTIGYGHYSASIYKGQQISQATAEQFLKNDVEAFANGVSKMVKVAINQNQFDALVSFAYNLGLTNLETSTLLKFVNQKKFANAADEFDKWIYSNGKVLAGLVTRRAAEKALFLKPMPKPKTVSHPFHIVEKGESLWKIATTYNKKYGTTVEKLRYVNHLKSDTIFPKQKLYLK